MHRHTHTKKKKENERQIRYKKKLITLVAIRLKAFGISRADYHSSIAERKKT